MNRIFSMIGLGRRAGKVTAGQVAVEQAVKSKKACLVIVATDASDRSKKDFKSMCEYRHIPCLEYGLMEELGHAVGGEFNAALAVSDSGFANQILKLAEEEKK
ncbi:MAG: ribosomal L7Ae/L30e/S12e/Gadd45 family protein [Lachnospiraceae bacterium]|nr:ribosomal L7Ae/L30e/S12e/Gadd45 family protein [Lachnospiraceae bacterium]